MKQVDADTESLNQKIAKQEAWLRSFVQDLTTETSRLPNSSEEENLPHGNDPKSKMSTFRLSGHFGSSYLFNTSLIKS